MINIPLIEVKKISLTLGFSPEGKPMELMLVASQNRELYVEPGHMAMVIGKHPVTGEETVQEFLLEKYMSWAYVPIINPTIEADEPVIDEVFAVQTEQENNAPN